MEDAAVLQRTPPLPGEREELADNGGLPSAKRLRASPGADQQTTVGQTQSVSQSSDKIGDGVLQGYGDRGRSAKRDAPMQDSGDTQPSVSATAGGGGGGVAAGSGTVTDTASAARGRAKNSARSGGGRRFPVRRKGCRDISCYEILRKIGEGTYGEVLLARDKATGEIRALKRIKADPALEVDGFPITALREISILSRLYHENIVNLVEVVTARPTAENDHRGANYIVFEYAEYDVTGLCDSGRVHLTPMHIKSYMKQLLEGLFYLHSVRKFLHRDIKGSNLLVTQEGVLKICDFGLARPFKKGKLTNRVCTIWYRAPELLMGSRTYDGAIDIWAAGVVFLELLCGQPVFRTQTEPEQLKSIWRMFGTPTNENWPKHAECPLWRLLRPLEHIPRRWRDMRQYRDLDPRALDLADQLLTLDPEKRITASAALSHDYFWTEPIISKPEDLPRFDIESAHDFEVKNRGRPDGDPVAQRGAANVADQAGGAAAAGAGAAAAAGEAGAAAGNGVGGAGGAGGFNPANGQPAGAAGVVAGVAGVGAAAGGVAVSNGGKYAPSSPPGPPPSTVAPKAQPAGAGNPALGKVQPPTPPPLPPPVPAAPAAPAVAAAGVAAGDTVRPTKRARECEAALAPNVEW